MLKRYPRVLFAFAFILLLCLQAQAQNCLAGYSNLIPITITNPNGTPLTNFEVRLTVNTQTLIGANQMQADGDDIRFTTAGCCGVIPYFLESGINTPSTGIWVRVPGPIPAGGSVTIYMAYGNASATAGSDGVATFSFFEDFNSSTIKFTSPCGPPSFFTSAGNLNMSWGSQGVIVSDSIFPQSQVYTAEMDVVTSSGNWPGLYWARVSDQTAYAMLTSSNQPRIAVSGASTGHCQGMNWAGPILSAGTTTGIWSLTWIATGDIVGEFPTIGQMTSTDVTHAATDDKVLMIGGISSGSGSITANWVRARKWAATPPSVSIGSAQPFPNVSVSLGPDQSVCAGVSVTFDAGAGFNSYNWSNGASTQSITVSTPGTYIVTVTDVTGCPGLDTVMLSNVPAPSPFLGNDTLICTGNSIVLNPGSYSSYSWSTGSTNPTISVGTAGTYSVTVTNSSGCTGTDAIVVTTQQGATVTISQTGTACEGDTLVLDAGSGFIVYNWSTGGSTPTIAVTASGTYSVTVTDANGCTASDNITPTFNPAPVVSFSYVATGLSVGFADATSNAAAWAWDFGDGNTAFVPYPQHTYATGGSYTVCLTVTDNSGCEASLCDTVTVVAIGVANALPGTTVELSPVPARDVLNVAIVTDYPTSATLRLTDVQGRVLMTQPVELQGQNNVRIGTDELGAGIYFLHLETSKGAAVHKFSVE